MLRFRALGGLRACSTLARTRNVGIIAHIDSGKTTTTERMLLLAGVTRAAGSVDDGDTVTDHLEQERERGITIQAAAVSFGWRNHGINLIDTPGHVDFTIEVERSARVLDGAALLVDAVAGAQAQTETVWRQARAHNVPAVAFVNKMDREGADFDEAVASLEARLGLTALPLQRPIAISGGGNAASAAVDLVDWSLIQYSESSSSSNTGGRAQRGAALTLERIPLGDGGTDVLSSAALEEAQAARESLIERIAELDPDGPVAELYLEEAQVGADDLRSAIRKLTLSNLGVPTMCGSSLKGYGVEPLLDAIISYLPSPADLEMPVLSNGSEKAVALNDAADGVALAFKVVHDLRSKKPIVWLRVYSGELNASDTLHNTRTGGSERLLRLHTIQGEDAMDVRTAGRGSIVAASGLKSTQTGDTLLLSPSSGCNEMRLPGLITPTPVFFTAIETESASQQTALDEAIRCICLEDPSITVRQDANTGQQLLGGMGELHLQVAIDRLKR